MALKIGVIYQAGVANHCALDKFCQARGYLIDAMRQACDQVHLNCSFSWYNGSEYGDVGDNGIGTGLVGAIQRGEFDTSIPVFTPTYRRYQAIRFSEQSDANNIVLMTRAPTVEQGLDWSIVTAFQWPIWIAFLIVLFLAAGSISFGNASNETSLNKIFNSLFFLASCEFKSSLLRFHSVRILIGTWIIGTVVLSTAYSCALFSNKVLTKTNFPFTDLETFVQCLEERKCSITASTSSMSVFQHLMSPDDVLGERIRRSLEFNPMRFAPVEERIRLVIEEKNHYLVSISNKETILVATSSNRNCLYYTVDLNYNEIASFPFAKNSSYSKTLSNMALSFREFGILQRLKKTYFDESFECGKNREIGVRSSFDSHGQTLSSMIAIFSFYILGISIAAIAFLTESILFRFIL